jgi:hypothetical protein
MQIVPLHVCYMFRPVFRPSSGHVNTKARFDYIFVYRISILTYLDQGGIDVCTSRTDHNIDMHNF